MGIDALNGAGYPGDDDKLSALFGGMSPEDVQAVNAALGMRGPTAAGLTTTPPPLAAVQPTAPQPAAAMPSIPAPPTLRGVDPSLITNLTQQAAAKSAPLNRADYKPHWWERLLSVPIAGVQGFGEGDKSAERGARAGQDFMWHRYNQAENARQGQVKGLNDQIALAEKSQGAYHTANELAEENYKNQGSQYDRFLKTEEADNTVRQRAPRMETDEKGNPHFYYSTLGGKEFEGAPPAGYENAQTRKSEDENTPATGARPEKVQGADGGVTFRVKTKSGGYMPYQPKSVEEGALLGDPLSLKLYRQAHPPKEKAGEKPASKAQYRQVQAKRDTDWQKARDEFDKKVNDPKTKYDKNAIAAARQELYDRRQEVQDEFEGQISTLGGEPEHIDLPRNLFGEQAAAAQSAPAAAPATGKGGEARGNTGPQVGQTVTLKSGKSVTITKIHADGKHFDYK